MPVWNIQWHYRKTEDHITTNIKDFMIRNTLMVSSTLNLDGLYQFLKDQQENFIISNATTLQYSNQRIWLTHLRF